MENCHVYKKLCNTLQLDNTKKINGIKVLASPVFLNKLLQNFIKMSKLAC